MAKIWLERSYIDVSSDEDNYDIEILIKDGSKYILAGRVEMSPRSWVYLDYNEEGDLIINNSPSMEHNKWDHIIPELLYKEPEDE